MDTQNPTETVEQTAQETTAAAEPATTPDAKAKNAPKAKPTKPTKAAASKGKAAKAKPAKPAKEPKPRKEKAPKEDLVVFAFRLTEAERDAIHKTAGPRNATQFVRRAAVAFAHEDDAAFRAVIKEARQLRG